MIWVLRVYFSLVPSFLAAVCVCLQGWRTVRLRHECTFSSASSRLVFPRVLLGRGIFICPGSCLSRGTPLGFAPAGRLFSTAQARLLIGYRLGWNSSGKLTWNASSGGQAEPAGALGLVFKSYYQYLLSTLCTFLYLFLLLFFNYIYILVFVISRMI